ncbi:MAG: hypothetical protein A3D87_04290 [Omnitrophica WOR_2 bacterium RIFCSPHIGHO2_02_FULL_50_17]|nr:MAG: hypothetical protein A3D87_04290 [Omnitrophica WOR_2 bacterium RIFCSPHIGHO2_02_FULL_50_17]
MPVTRAGTGMAKNQRARPGVFGHLLTNVRGATALFPDMLLVEELVGGVECWGNRKICLKDPKQSKFHSAHIARPPKAYRDSVE